MNKKFKKNLELEYFDFPFKYVLAKFKKPTSEKRYQMILNEVLAYCKKIEVRKLIFDLSEAGHISHMMQKYEKDMFNDQIRFTGAFYRAIIVSSDTFFSFSIQAYEGGVELDHFQYFSNLPEAIIWLSSIQVPDEK